MNARNIGQLRQLRSLASALWCGADHLKGEKRDELVELASKASRLLDREIAKIHRDSLQGEDS